MTRIAPGKFAVFAKKGGETLSISSIVYPPDWKLRILPQVATVRVGDRITFKIILSDSKGRLLGPVTYFRFLTPYYQQPIPGVPSKSAIRSRCWLKRNQREDFKRCGLELLLLVGRHC